MKFRWTMKDLKEKTDNEIIRGIVAERMSDLNPYSPLKIRLQQIYNKVDEQIGNEVKKQKITIPSVKGEG